MNIQYNVKSNGELLIRNPETKRTLILHDAYWYLEGKREGLFNIPPSNSPILDIPKNLFEGLYSGIRRWHKSFTRYPNLNVEEPLVSNFKKAIESLENELVDLLENDGRVNISWYSFHKEISSN